jgi:hypothetical protein
MSRLGEFLVYGLNCQSIAQKSNICGQGWSLPELAKVTEIGKHSCLL